MSQRSFWLSLRRHLTVKGLMLAAIALFLTAVSVDAFYHNALAAEFTDSLVEGLTSVSQAEVSPATVASEQSDLDSQQTMARLLHNGLTHGSLTRHHLTSAHLFSAV